MASRNNAFKETINQYVLKSAGRCIPYGMGCAWLGRGSRDRETIKREVEVLALAYHAGFRYFDTAAAYGESEVVVGEFVSQVPRESIFLATKSYVLENVSPHEAAEAVKLNLELSLKRLRTDYLDLFQIHDIFGLTNILAANGVLEMLLDARQSGKFRHIGLATRQLDLLEATVNHGGFDTILTFSDYTPIDRIAADVVLSANHSGRGVINGSPLLSGLLAGGDPGQFHVPEYQKIHLKRQKQAIRFHKFCQENNMPLLALALQFPTRQPAIDITLTGPANPEEMKEALAALMMEIPSSFWDKVEQWYTQEQA